MFPLPPLRLTDRGAITQSGDAVRLEMSNRSQPDRARGTPLMVVEIAFAGDFDAFADGRNSTAVNIGSNRTVSGTSKNSGLDGSRSGKDSRRLARAEILQPSELPRWRDPRQRGACLSS